MLLDRVDRRLDERRLVADQIDDVAGRRRVFCSSAEPLLEQPSTTSTVFVPDCLRMVKQHGRRVVEAGQALGLFGAVLDAPDVADA